MAKKITLEVLAAMMKEGFDDIQNRFVTKEDLLVLLEKYATKDDLKFALEKYATKDDLNEKFNEVLNKEDLMIKLLKDMQEEIVAGNGGRYRQEDRINNHEIRIKKLETTKIKR